MNVFACVRPRATRRATTPIMTTDDGRRSVSRRRPATGDRRPASRTSPWARDVAGETMTASTRTSGRRRMVRGCAIVFVVVVVACVSVGVEAAATATATGVRGYYVNSRGEATRRLAMEHGFSGMFDEGGLTRVGAVDATRASTLVSAYESEACKRTHWAKSGELAVSMFSGEYLERLGASLSHLEAIYKAYDDGASAALILEDDAKPDLIPTWSTDFDGYVERLPEDWTLVQLSALGRESAVETLFFDWQRERSRAPGKSLSTLPKGVRRLKGTQAYLISRRGMSRLVKAYRAPGGKVDVCAMTCVEFEECVLADGVHLDDHYRVATPPLFVRRRASDDAPSESVIDYLDDSRHMVYSWAVSLSLTNGLSANMRMDGEMIANVLDEGLKVPDRLTPNSFAEHFRYYCKLHHGGGAKCSIKRRHLANQKPPKAHREEIREVVVDERRDVDAASDATTRLRRNESSLGRVAVRRDTPPPKTNPLFDYATSTPFISMYIFGAVAAGVLVTSFVVKRRDFVASAPDELEVILPIDARTEEYYS